jgi:hypothetical protein
MLTVIPNRANDVALLMVVAWITNFNKIIDLPLEYLSESDLIFLDGNRLFNS